MSVIKVVLDNIKNGSILLTGTTGFIGRNLIEKNKDVFCGVYRKNKPSFCKNVFKVESINSETDWSGAFEGVNCVVHLAGIAHSGNFTSEQYDEVNTAGTLSLAKAASDAKVKRFVFISTIGVNGSSTHNEMFRPNDVPAPHNDYANSKLKAENGLRDLAKKTGLEVVIIRPTLVYGESAPGNFGLLVRLVAKLPFLPFGLVSNKKHFISVQNLADLIMVCTWHPNAIGQIFLATDGEPLSIKEFTSAISKGMNKFCLQLPIPVIMMRFFAGLLGKSALIEQLVGDLEVDASNTFELLNWKPPMTLNDTMKTLMLSRVNDD